MAGMEISPRARIPISYLRHHDHVLSRRNHRRHCYSRREKEVADLDRQAILGGVGSCRDWRALETMPAAVVGFSVAAAGRLP